MLRAILKGQGIIVDLISAELDTVRGFYFGPMSQVRVSRWSKGLFVLLGVAACCLTAFTGEGTAQALGSGLIL
ncbi:hypothetical protein [Acetobacter sp. P1H12_c]|uniref:hypothetical protein n=1 Tax=Acetobacter sp. P1H12_c TaxID=2762621 RepID=UPI001C04F88D|nr:hypothetical protein [Acetobacter sp. P1H12_c]